MSRTRTTSLLALIIPIVAMLALRTTSTPNAAQPEAPRGNALDSLSLYNGLKRPIMVSVEPAAWRGAVTLEVVLLDQPGAVIAEPIALSAEERTFDLAQKFPMIWDLRRAAYAQLLKNGEPTGSALVLQPMLSRLTMWTVRDLRPDGRTPYTKIVGWGPKPPEIQQREEDAGAEGATPVPEEPLEIDDTAIFSGLRIYPEQDAVLVTDLGEMRYALRPDEAPNTAWNFMQLVDGGYYRDIPFHRIVPATREGHPFVIQAGDPSGTGSGGPGYWLPIEPSRLAHEFGVISMARADDPDSAGGQIFVCLSREGTARLDGQYCAFGYAVDGARTILSISEVELADVSTGRAVTPPIIQTAYLAPAPPRMPGKGRPDRPVTREDAVPQNTQPIRIPR